MPTVKSSLAILSWILILLGSCFGGSAAVISDTYHTDGRTTPKLLFNPYFRAAVGATGEDTARAFLAGWASAFDLPGDLSNLELQDVQTSLLARHFRFHQVISGIPVEMAEIIVSVSRQDGRIMKVFNNTYPQERAVIRTGNAISGEQALDIAWNHLRVHGDLTSSPVRQLLLAPEGNTFRLIYKTQIDVTAPFGYWEHRIDALSGEILSVRSTAIDEKPLPEEKMNFSAYRGPVTPRAEATARYEAAIRAEAQRKSLEETRASGTAKVFDPDPRTTLADDSLRDASAAALFTNAYLTRNLLDITQVGGTYSLTGPWVNIINFEAPNTAPSTSATGNWTAVRGNNAFNDAVTYFHIDQNQRYIQSLGYTGATGIQNLSIGVDSDGLSGDDNSHYIPGTNRIAYGHGCVDDNEDADVILHEYGHALQHDMVPSWSGGDSGAIGEGFGDYWGGSYSYSTPNGPTYHPEWAFTWDGHLECWDGRVMNRTTAQYDPNSSYPAHTVVNGVNGDELWSTPIWQAFLTLSGMGRSRTEMDKIILESHFGLGSGVTMPDMANATIAAAQGLYPAGPHAQVYFDKFAQVNILQLPLELNSVTVVDPGNNGAADPTETIGLTLSLHNNGGIALSSVSATLTAGTAGVTVPLDVSTYPNIPAAGNAGNNVPFQVSIPYTHPCGAVVQLSLDVIYTDTAVRTQSFSFTIDTGLLQENQQSASPELGIPDNNPTGITSTIVFTGTGEVVNTGFNVDLNITHTWIGDLLVTLRSPDSVSVILHNRTGSSADNIIGNYPGTLTPNQALSAFDGHPLDGTWTLTVSDNAGSDVGTLHTWAIHNPFGSGAYCEIPGDVDGNGIVNLDDAILAMQKISGALPPSVRLNQWADVNSDGVIGIEEVDFILGFLAGTNSL